MRRPPLAEAGEDEVAAAPPAVGTELLTEPLADGNGKVVKTKQFALKPMSLEEAALQLELLGHDFFVFTNAETSRTNVLYRRNDGHYGLIEPADN